MDRDDRLAVLKFLDERGAFFVKRAVDRVARRLSVSRVTAYNYLEQIRAAASYVMIRGSGGSARHLGSWGDPQQWPAPTPGLADPLPSGCGFREPPTPS